MKQGAGAEDSEEEVATPQVVGTQNAIPSKFTLIERKETAHTEAYIGDKRTSVPRYNNVLPRSKA